MSERKVRLTPGERWWFTQVTRILAKLFAMLGLIAIFHASKALTDVRWWMVALGVLTLVGFACTLRVADKYEEPEYD